MMRSQWIFWSFVDVWYDIIWRPMVILQNLAEKEDLLKKHNIDSRYDGMNHVIVKQGKQTQCAECHKNITFRCEKCDVALQVKCSVEYHTE